MTKTSTGNFGGIMVGLILFVVGVALCLTLIGALMGVPLILYALGCGGKRVWRCQRCGYHFDR